MDEAVTRGVPVVASERKLNPATIYNWLQVAGLKTTNNRQSKWSDEDTEKLIQIMESSEYESKTAASKAAAEVFGKDAGACMQKYYDATRSKKKKGTKKKALPTTLDKKVLHEGGALTLPQGSVLMNKFLSLPIDISSVEIFPDKIILHL